MPHAEVNILDEMEKLLKFYAWSLNAADFCTGNGHLKRKVSVCFTGSFPYWKILNAQSVVQLPYITLLIPFTTSFEQLLAHPGQILKVLVFWIKFSNTSFSTLHICSHCTHHMGHNCS